VAGRGEARRALVTGAGGFLGSHLVARLAADGWEVHRVGRSPLPPGPGREWQADLADAGATRAVVAAAAPDVVFHLASAVTGTRDAEAVVPIFRDTAAATVSVLAAAHAAGAGRVVLSGSMEEPAGGEPQSPYAAAKEAAAVYGRLYRFLYGLDVVHLRIHMVYGPGQRDRRKLVPSVVDDLLGGRSPAVSSGTREVDWVHVDDVVEALVAAATVDPAPTEPVDVGTGVRASVREVVEHLVAAVGSGATARYGAVADRPHEVEPVADVEAAAAALGGWRPGIGLEEGLARTVAAERESQGD
jgi:UDP-glucose 4-epimerase